MRELENAKAKSAQRRVRSDECDAREKKQWRCDCDCGFAGEKVREERRREERGGTDEDAPQTVDGSMRLLLHSAAISASLLAPLQN